MLRDEKELKEYLARIRKTIADSERLVSQAELRIVETDRMLERQGLTREQVMNMRFTDAQVEAANAELKRRGLDPLEKWDDLKGLRPAKPSTFETQHDVDIEPSSGMEDEVAYRQRKFGMMMKPFQI